MTSESTPPLPTSGGGMRYAIIGVLLLLGAGALYFFAGTEGEEEPSYAERIAAIDAGVVERPQQFQEELLEFDAGIDAGPVAEEPEEETPAAMGSGMRRQPRQCDGQIDRSGLSAVIRRQQSQVRNCYERALKANNLLQGTVNVRLRIGRTGRVDSVSVNGSLRDAEVFSCVRRLARDWQFPPVTGGSCAEVSAPFQMTPRN